MELKAIERTDRTKNRLHAALSIYRETILPEAQNPERQILYWIDHSKESLSDEFKCFAIERAREVVGYLQYSFFREEHIFFFEYLCVREAKRTGLVPTPAVKAIEDYLAENYPPDFTIVFEVAQTRTDGAWKSDTRLIRYFKRLGFRHLHFQYRYPILQSYDGETSYPADLMIRLPSQRIELNASQMRTVLRCIYFKHYLRWDRPFLEPDRFAERERLIDELYSNQVSRIADDEIFPTTGDPKRAGLPHFVARQRQIASLFDQIFGPKFLRVMSVVLLLLLANWMLHSPWLLLPFVLAVAAVYCLAEDTDATRKLFVVIISRFRRVGPRQL